MLTEAEKRSGCVLVDLGADTTTVSVYYKNILRHLAVIPLGSNNITKDITTLQIEERDAEKMKLHYASAYTENSEIDNTLQLPIDNERSIESRKFIEIVEARIEEIIENVWFQVPNEFADKLLGGIVLTGGGSNMKNIETAFRNHTHIEKIRIGKFVAQTINTTNADINAKDGTMNTILGLLEKGDMNCAGKEISDDLFATSESKTATSASDLHKPQRPSAVVPGSGIVLTEAEKQKAEEEARRKKEEEEEELRRQAEEEARREAQIRKENSSMNKFMKKVKNFMKKITEEEE